ncbi:MAG: TonB-dependent receptor plug domain-containing protein, partial [Elusimicrobia bacterium]|nr:TonB-dependent receptor plug domain-containing protein [Elusimicrobiota bacterium]
MKKALLLAALILAAKSIKCEDRTSEIFLSLAGKNNYDNYFIYDNAKSIDISDQNTKISQAANASPSFVLRENSGNLGLSLGSIRGFGSNQTAVVYDGIKLPKDITSTYDLSLIPTITADKIYILNGGWSSVFGSNAEGGVIGIKTQSIKKDSQSVEIISDYGSYDKKRYLLKSGVSKNNV